MPKHMIMPIDNSLSFEARGMLGTMLNNPESDYRTAEELCCFFEKDSLRTIRETLDELVKHKYVIQLANKSYAVNKMMIPNMKSV